MNETLEEIAHRHGLKLIETTSERNGYPCCVKKAIIGFDNFEQAEKIAEENNLSIEIFTKYDGWNFYYRTNDKAFEPFLINADYYGDNFNDFSVVDIEDFYDYEVRPFLADMEDFDSLTSFIDRQKKIFEELQSIDENELVITNEGSYYETIQKRQMVFSYDSKTTAIGLIED